MSKKTIFCIIGRSGSGKDTLTGAVCERLGKKCLISYSTRPRRVGEGDTHIFIDKSEVEGLKPFIAYTKIGEFEYFATEAQLETNDFYIIDPKGYHDLVDNDRLRDKYRFVSIYINTTEELRAERVNKRGDDAVVYTRRCLAEAEQFQQFEFLHEMDYTILNINFDTALEQMIKIITFEN